MKNIKESLKQYVLSLSKEEQKKWGEIYSKLMSEVNDQEYKNKAAYRSAANKVYEKAVLEYKSQLKH